MIRKWAVSLLAAALCGAGGLWAGTTLFGADGPPRTGTMAGFWEVEATPAPAQPFRTVAGAPMALTDFAGETLVVNFWATWCPPCLRELPSLDRLQAALGPRARVLAISMDRQGAEIVLPYWQQAGLEVLDPYLDPAGELAMALEVLSLPETIVIDGAGRIRGRLSGEAVWDSAEAMALVDYYID